MLQQNLCIYTSTVPQKHQLSSSNVFFNILTANVYCSVYLKSRQMWCARCAQMGGMLISFTVQMHPLLTVHSQGTSGSHQMGDICVLLDVCPCFLLTATARTFAYTEKCNTCCHCNLLDLFFSLILFVTSCPEEFTNYNIINTQQCAFRLWVKIRCNCLAKALNFKLFGIIMAPTCMSLSTLIWECSCPRPQQSCLRKPLWIYLMHWSRSYQCYN